MRYKLLISLILVGLALFTYSFSADHESYLSVTKIRFNEEVNTFECEMKLTAHDFENAIRSNYGKPFILDKATLENSNNKLINQYLQSKFNIKIDQEKVFLNYIGYEVELTDFVWIYFEIECPEKFNNITLSNLMLTETFAMQQNVTHITKETNTQSFVFTKNETLKTFNWNE